MHDNAVEEIRNRRKLLIEKEFNNSPKVLGEKLREFEKKYPGKIVDMHNRDLAGKTT
jgi:hypothetical protein